LSSFLAVWLYGGWPILLVMTLIYSGSLKLIDAFQTSAFKSGLKKFFSFKNFFDYWQGSLWTLLGLAVGLLLNPYFPVNLKFYWVQIVEIALINYQKFINVGNEWYPYGFINLITTNSLIVALFIAGAVLLWLNRRQIKADELTWGILSLAFVILTLKSTRNIEFFVPVAVIFFAFTFSRLLANLPWAQDRQMFSAKNPWLIVLLIFFVSWLLTLPNDFLQIKKNMLVGLPLNYLQDAALWLKENTSQGEIVFNDYWDSFPMLFYYNDHNYYLTGLDHTFMYKKDSVKFAVYEKIVQGEIEDNLALQIKDNFNAHYVILPNRDGKFMKILQNNEAFSEVFSDKMAKIFKIIYELFFTHL